ncbi:MAG: hypothetical protein K2H17_07535 [Duncaniella sp.]|uniref:thioredoxin-like domain-containing protein n=1 Tax=Duncaniella sp. TaxID=2518496 RepID=UPI0023CF08D4|nr:thioredoxin-like domain-containing protein [Duncaniella sp.]MDE5989234.1 hypothetical protein [Duncaniella sp.]
MKFTKDVCIVADGDTIGVKTARNIVLDKNAKVGEDGKLSFALVFGPVGKKVKAIDLTGRGEDSLRLWGIDLTGVPEPEFPVGLPERMRVLDRVDEPLPAVALERGITKVNLHFLNHTPHSPAVLTPELSDNFVVDKLSAVRLDSCGNGSIEVEFVGPAFLSFTVAGMRSNVLELWLTPSDKEVDVYVDSRRYGDMALANRPEKYKKRRQRVFVTGSLSPLNNELNKMNDQPLFADIMALREKPLYKMSTEQYVDFIEDFRQKSIGSLESSETSVMMKEYMKATYDACYLGAISSSSLITSSYWANNPQADRLEMDSITGMPKEDYYKRIERICLAAQKVKPGDPRLMFSPYYQGVICFKWEDAGVDARNPAAVRKYHELIAAANDGVLSADSLAVFADFPVLAERLVSINDEALALKSRLASMTCETPEVAPEKLIEAIVAPHKGKVVMIDLWNTWCGPCRRAISRIEPEKSGELASPDIVWIYIADNTSPLKDYYKIIPDIRGLHYRLDKDQIEAVRTQFGADGIPYYILVDRQGGMTGRRDLRDHEKFRSALLEEVAKR